MTFTPPPLLPPPFGKGKDTENAVQPESKPDVGSPEETTPAVTPVNNDVPAQPVQPGVTFPYSYKEGQQPSQNQPAQAPHSVPAPAHPANTPPNQPPQAPGQAQHVQTPYGSQSPQQASYGQQGASYKATITQSVTPMIVRQDHLSQYSQVELNNQSYLLIPQQEIVGPRARAASIIILVGLGIIAVPVFLGVVGLIFFGAISTMF